VDPVLKAEVSPVEFSGLRDNNVQQYCEWQQPEVKNSSLKAAVQKATDFVIEKGLDLLPPTPYALSTKLHMMNAKAARTSK